MSMSTAKLVMWLHWQLMWLLFLLSTSQPLEDQPPVPPILNTSTHLKFKNIVTAVLSAKVNPCGNLGHVCVCVCMFPTHAKEWFQKTQTGLVLSSVSSSVYSKVMGGSRMGGRGGPSLCTVALTMAVLITGRLGSLERQNPRLGMTWNDPFNVFKHRWRIRFDVLFMALLHRCTQSHSCTAEPCQTDPKPVYIWSYSYSYLRNIFLVTLSRCTHIKNT